MNVTAAESATDAQQPADIDLDRTDTELIRLLRETPRIENRSLARKLGVSAPTLLSRLRRLNEIGACELRLQRDFKAMGYTNMVSVEVDVSGRGIDDVAAEIAQLPESMAIVGFLEAPALSAQLIVKDTAHLRRLYLEKLAQIRGVRRIRTNISLKIHRYSNTYSEPSIGTYDRVPSVSSQPAVDEFDEAMLELLRHDASLSNREIAKSLEASEHKVRRRLNAILDSKLATFNYLVSPRAAELGVWGNVRLVVEPAKHAEVLDMLLASESCVAINEAAGDWTFLAWIVCENTQDLRALSERLSGVSIAVNARLVDQVFKQNCDYARVL